jgi:glutamate-1-semialdehyde 2,1-aminomutase
MDAFTHNDTERALIEAAKRVLPGGSFGNLPTEIVISRGSGGHVWDMSGNDYIDFLLGSGPMFIGHGHPDVTAAVSAQAPLGTTFFGPNQYGIQLAEVIVEAVTCAEKVRFVCTGTEATLYALRVARAFRKRDKILKFEGGFHGMSDTVLMGWAPKQPGNFPQAMPDSAGIPRSVRDDVLIAPFNDPEMATSLIREHKDDLGAVIVEPFQRVIPPAPGFLQALRKVTAELGIPLIFDEIVTGFRFAYGGAQEYYGVVPDICALGKIMGGGFPLAAVAGRADIMAHFDSAAVDEADFLPQLNTLAANPIAAAAGLATLEVLRRPGTYERAFANGRELMRRLSDLLKRSGLPAHVIGEPVLFDVVFTDQPVHDYRSWIRSDAALLRKFNRLLRERGIFKSETKYYVSVAHTQADIDQATEAWASALDVLTGRR